jgi:hypothetical protein
VMIMYTSHNCPTLIISLWERQGGNSRSMILVSYTNCLIN